MSKIKIVTDSTVDLDQSLLEELEIEMIPLTITVDGQSYLDHVDYTSTQFVEILENAKEFPKT
ncbi:MAG TPA: DegV family protein, partial [Massilibacterium sp.]|nr:DegV family protein [Massilibacterium sp.]